MTDDAGLYRGIFDDFEGYRTPTLDEFHAVLTGGLVALDTNVLLNLYRYTDEARDDRFNVLERIREQLWVPHQALAEFWGSREGVLTDPRDTTKTRSALVELSDKGASLLRAWFNRVSLPPEHASRELLTTLNSAFDTVTSQLDEFDDGSAATEAARDTNSDVVLQRLEQVLAGHVGLSLDKANHQEAVEEGARRVEERRPPGYKDRSRGDENGDYLVWEQLLCEATKRSCDVLFVTADVKEDWWRVVRGEPRGPRLELVAEMRERVGHQLYMLRPTQFLDVSRRTLDVAVRDESVEDADRVDRLTATGRIRETVVCPRCESAVDVLLGRDHGDTAHAFCESCEGRFFVHRKFGDATVGGLIGRSDEDAPVGTRSDGLPPAAHWLHQADPSFPMADSDYWQRMYGALSDATREVALSPKPTLQELNALTRYARDAQAGGDSRVSRADLDYVAKALMFAGRLAEDMSPEEIAAVFTQNTLGRRGLSQLAASDIEELAALLNGCRSFVVGG